MAQQDLLGFREACGAELVQGQQLGAVGQTGAVDRAQLHFEIRYAASPKDRATPVDPGLLLPQH